jgi:hypothetical protein
VVRLGQLDDTKTFDTLEQMQATTIERSGSVQA